MKKDNMECKKNFTSFEKELILELVEKHKQILENKTTNAVFNKQKRDAWMTIESEFNSNPGISSRRNDKQLMLCYKNMKFRATRDRAKERLEIFKTGGGIPDTKTNTDSISERILAIGGIVTPLENEFDSDAQYNCITIEPSENPEISICNSPTVIENSISENTENAAIPSKKAFPKRKRKYQTTNSEESFINYTKEKEKMMWEEHKLKMKILETQLQAEEAALQANSKKLELYNLILESAKRGNTAFNL